MSDKVISCKDCGTAFEPRDSMMGDESQCQNCWEKECDRAWWEMHNKAARAGEITDRLLAESFYAGYTTGNSGADADLTLEKLQETYNRFASEHIETERLHPWQGMSLPMWDSASPTGLFSNGMPVFTSPYLGEQVTPAPPALPKGPYYQRRMKRWRGAHPSYTVGTGHYWLIGGQQIWCHPDDLPKLVESLNAVSQKESV